MCVFPAADRELFGLSFEEAREVVLARRRADPGGEYPIMTQQAMAILPKIREVDHVMRADSSRQDWVVEIHPEACFVALAEELGQAVAAPRPPAQASYSRVPGTPRAP